jgi:hypothetical protein
MILILFLTACGGKSDGGIRGIQENCITTNDQGKCNGTFKVVRGNNTHEFKKIKMNTDETVYLEMETTVEKGEMIITVINFDGIPVDYFVSPDEPASFALWVLSGGSEFLPIEFNVDNGKVVEGVTFSLSYKRDF